MSNTVKTFCLATVVVIGLIAQVGCHACCAPYDYTGPVAEGDCQACGGTWHQRRASAVTHYATADASAADQSLLADKGDEFRPAKTAAKLDGTKISGAASSGTILK